MMIWQTEQLKNALGVEVPTGISAGAIQFNSKDIKPGELFIAMTGGTRDGHEFVAHALEQGAAAVIISKDVQGIDANKIIKVEDTFEALSKLADYKRFHAKAKFIAVTGSVGKTSTKESLGKMLSEFGKTFVSRGNFNNFLGVPINLASMPDDADFVVMEIGMNAKNEIRPLVHEVSPHIAIITTVAEGHLEFFDSVDGIADAKSEIYEGLDINSGIAIVPRDISTYKRCLANIDRLHIQNIRKFGKSEETEVRFLSYTIIEDNNVLLKYKVFDSEIEFMMPFVPEHIAANFAPCLIVAHELKLDLDAAVIGLSKFDMGKGRGKIIHAQKDGKGFTIIADYYNSNPESLKAALNNLSVMDSEQKVAIIGDMGELGKNASELHKSMAEHINKAGVKTVLLAGELTNVIQQELDSSIICKSYSSTDALIGDLDNNLNGGELILIKASRFMRFEKIAAYLGVEHVF